MDTVKDLGLPTHVSGWRLSKRLSMFESVKWRQNMPGDIPHAFLSGLCWDLKRVLQDYPEDQVQCSGGTLLLFHHQNVRTNHQDVNLEVTSPHPA